MKNLEVIILGVFVIGYIAGKLHVSWNYYKKTGVMIEDVKDEFEGNK
jgi:predicted glycosyltransferase